MKRDGDDKLYVVKSITLNRNSGAHTALLESVEPAEDEEEEGTLVECLISELRHVVINLIINTSCNYNFMDGVSKIVHSCTPPKGS